MGSRPEGKRAAKAGWAAVLVAGLAGCGGAGDGTAPEPKSQTTSAQQTDPFEGLSMRPDAVQEDAVRLAQQASFGPSGALLKDIRRLGPTDWVAQQLAASGSVYTSGGDDKIHRNTSPLFFCDTPGQADNE